PPAVDASALPVFGHVSVPPSWPWILRFRARKFFSIGRAGVHGYSATHCVGHLISRDVGSGGNHCGRHGESRSLPACARRGRERLGRYIIPFFGIGWV